MPNLKSQLNSQRKISQNKVPQLRCYTVKLPNKYGPNKTVEIYLKFLKPKKMPSNHCKFRCSKLTLQNQNLKTETVKVKMLNKLFIAKHKE